MKGFFKNLFVFILGIGSLSYLVIETLTVVDMPFIGNMDEATATIILISSMRYFGLDFSSFFGKKLK